MIKKAVLPVAGIGTRFLPASKATPKEMLPIIDKPLVQYAVEEAIEIGIEEIVFITNNEKHSIKRHFEKNQKLEQRLVEKNKEEFVDKLNPKIFKDIKFHYVIQEEQNGLGDAVLKAESLINGEAFALLLPDDLFFSKKSCLSQLSSIFLNTNASTIAVNKIDKNNIIFIHRNSTNFNIATFNLQTRQLRVLTNTEFDESPCIAPNGNVIIYATKEQGYSMLAGVNISSNVGFKLPALYGELKEPAWSPFLR